MKKLILAILLAVSTTAFAQTAPPNEVALVRSVAANYAIGTEEGLAAFVDASVCALNAKNSRWGHLRKTGSGTQIHGHAHDGALYLSNTPGQSTFVDYIGAAGAPNASITWGPDMPRYSPSDWMAPHNCATNPDPPVNPPTPNPVVNFQPILDRIDALAADVRTLNERLIMLQGSQQITNDQLVGIAARVEVVLTSNDRIIRQLLSPPDYNGGGLFGGTLRPIVKPVTP